MNPTPFKIRDGFLLLAAIIAAAGGAFLLLHMSRGAATLSLPRGLVLGVLLARPRRHWPAIVLIQLVGALFSWLCTGASVERAAATAVIACLETAGTAWVLRRQIGEAPDLGAWRTFQQFILTAGLIAPTAGGVLQAACVGLVGGSALTPATALTCATADSLGMVVVAPLVVFILRGNVAALLQRERRGKTAALLVAATLTTLIILSQTRYPLLFMVSPWLLVIGSEFDFVGVSMFVPVLAIATFGCTALGHGPFALNSQLAPPERLLLVQAFIYAALMIGHFAATVTRRHRGAMLALRAERNSLFESRRELAGNAEQFRLLMSGVVDHAIYLMDGAGHVVSWNAGAEQIKGYRPEEIVGRHFSIFFTPEDRANGEPGRVLESAHALGHLERECWRMRKDGSRFWARVVLNAVRDGTGRVVGFAKVAQDLSSRRRADALLREALGRARQASEAKSRFLAGMSHELRTPLNGILGYAQLLQLDGGLTAEQSRYVNAMMGAGQHLLGMISAVLDMSMIESDRMELRPTQIDVRAASEACLDVIRPGALAKQLGLSLHVAAGAPACILADDTRLRQVLVNLLGNAVKYVPAGQIVLRLLPGHAPSHMRFEVADTGPGIAPHQQPRLFGDFARLGAGESQAVEGAGLGLAITAGLVRRMGGSIGYADNPGGGAVFWIEVPAGDCAPAAAAPPAPAAAARSLRLLVVDDVEMNCDIAGRFLTGAGHAVSVASSGLAALEAVAAGDFDAVLMDVQMPGMTGLEATALIRAMPPPRGRVPVIAMTAQAFTDQIALCLQAGMDLHVSKPIDREVLLATVERAVAHAAGRAGEITARDVVQEDAHELPVLDEVAYGAVCEILPHDALQGYLATLIRQGETLLIHLDRPPGPEAEHALADVAHAIGGSAGNFGFYRLASAAQDFERVARSTGADRQTETAALATVTAASVAKLRTLVAA